MNTKMAAHVAHNCTHFTIYLIINTLSINTLCANWKFCVQIACFVCNQGRCVQSVCIFVHDVCSLLLLCADCNHL